MPSLSLLPSTPVPTVDTVPPPHRLITASNEAISFMLSHLGHSRTGIAFAHKPVYTRLHRENIINATLELTPTYTHSHTRTHAHTQSQISKRTAFGRGCEVCGVTLDAGECGENGLPSDRQSLLHHHISTASLTFVLIYRRKVGRLGGAKRQDTGVE